MRFDVKELFQQLPREPVTRPNEIWSVELFRHDGRERVCILLALDVFSGFPVVLDLTSGKARQVASKLEEACRSGCPETLWLDQSFELKSRDLKQWAEHRGIVIQYGAPYQKAMTARPLLEELRILLADHGSKKPGELKRHLADWRQRYKPTTAIN